MKMLFPDVEAKASFDLLSKLRGGYGGDLNKGVGVMQSGSKEAYSAIRQYQSDARESVQDEIKRLLQEANRVQADQLEQGKRAAEALKEVADNLKVGGG